MLASNCQVPLTSVLLLFELTRDYLIIVPTLAAVGISFYVSSQAAPSLRGAAADTAATLRRLQVGLGKAGGRQLCVEMSAGGCQRLCLPGYLMPRRPCDIANMLHSLINVIDSCPCCGCWVCAGRGCGGGRQCGSGGGGQVWERGPGAE